MVKKKETNFLERLLKIHGDKYIFDESTIKATRDKVDYVCKKHGKHSKKLSHLLEGKGCPECSKELRSYNKKDIHYFIKKGKEVYGDLHDYSISEYKGALEKVKVICKKHGEFEATVSNYYRGRSGCVGCWKEKTAEARKKSPEHYIKKLNEIHGDSLDFSKSNFNTTRDIITCVCKYHGEQTGKLNNYLNGMGCSVCNTQGGFCNKSMERSKESHLKIKSNLYLLKFYNNHEEFIKIGISNKFRYRMSKLKKESGYKVEKIDLIRGNLYEIFKTEQYILQKFFKYKYIPEEKFGGYTECLSIDILDKVQKKFDFFKKDKKVTTVHK